MKASVRHAAFLVTMTLTIFSAGGRRTTAAAAAPCAADQPARARSAVVLDTYGVWRMHCQLAPPVSETGETATFKYRWLNYETARAAQGWMVPEFDDRFWNRGPVTLAVKSAALAKV